MVVDGYQFDVEYQRALKAAGLKLLVVDDTGHAGAYVADLVLDQNAHATEDVYQQREPIHQASAWVPLRHAAARVQAVARVEAGNRSGIGRKVLVTVGGTDPDNVTLRVIDALRLLAEDDLEATVVVGGSNPHGDCLEREVAGRGQCDPFVEKRF